MQQRLLATLRRGGTTLGGFSTPQKVIAALGVALLVLGGLAFSRWAGTPTMAPLFTNLAADDASAIVDQLDSEGVSYELADGGSSVLVPNADVYRLRLSMSSAGLPASNDTGYALLDKQGVTSSQFQQQVTYQRALEGELSNTIGSIDGVKVAVVHLAIPQKDVFLDENGSPTASVLVETGPGQDVSGPQVQSIVNLVASSVQDLTPEAVTVVDGAGHLLSAAGAPGSAATGLQDQQTQDYESRMTGSLQAVLDRVVGPGNAVATVTAELDFDNVDRTSETFDAKAGVPPLSSSKTTEKYTGGAGGAGGVLGPDNIQVPGPGATNGTNNGTAATPNGTTNAVGGAGAYEKGSETNNNAVNKTTERTQKAPGVLKRQSVAVVLDAKASQAMNPTDLTATLNAAAGIDAARGDTLSLAKLPFDVSAADAAASDLKAASDAASAAQRGQLIRTALIAGAILIALIVAAVLSRRRRTVEALELEPLPANDLMLEMGEPRDLELVRTPELVAVGASPQREALSELVERQPAEVAELLRGWLGDRRS